MRYASIINKFVHPLLVRRVLWAYNKKIERKFKSRPDLAKPIDPEVTKQHLELYKKLGLPCSDKWLRLYSNLTGIIDYTYLPEDLFFGCIERVLNNCEMANGEAENKNLLSLFVDREYLPCTYLRYVRGIFFDEDYNVLFLYQVNDFLGKNHGKLIGKKAVDSLGGIGVKCFEFVNNQYISKDGIELTADWIKNEGESYIVQEMIQQCDFSSMFNPYSANTCRITTLRCPWNGEIVVTKAAMRFGVNEVAVDNMAAGGVAVGMSSYGELGPFAYSWDGMKRFDKHPSSGIFFKGSIHPYYNLMCEVVISQAKRIPNFNLMSWDVLADINGHIKIIEVNLVSQGTDVHQFAFGSFFGKYTEDVVDWVSQHLELDTFKYVRTF